MNTTKIILTLLIVTIISCRAYDSKSQIERYFQAKKWRYPFYISQVNPLIFRNRFYDEKSYRISYDTSSLLKFENNLLKQATQYFENRLSVDTTLGYVIEKPIIYMDESDSIVYSIGIRRFKLNTTSAALPCEGCESIENNSIFMTGNRAVFKIKADSVLDFKSWAD